MKKGITINFDPKDDSYVIKKARGQLTIDDIIQTINDSGDEGMFFICVNTKCTYDDYGYMVEQPKGDCVKCYSYDALKKGMGMK